MLVQKYIEATNTHNFNNLIDLISDTAIYQFTDKRCNGIQEIRKYFEKAWEMVVEEVYSARNVVCITATKDIKIYIYDYHYEGFHKGEFVSGSGKATNVFQLIDKDWKLILEHLN